MQKIGIYIDPSNHFLVIETPHALQFELHDALGKLLVTGNKLLQPLIRINIKRFVSGTYTLILHVEGGIVTKTVQL